MFGDEDWWPSVDYWHLSRAFLGRKVGVTKAKHVPVRDLSGVGDHNARAGVCTTTMYHIQQNGRGGHERNWEFSPFGSATDSSTLHLGIATQ